MRAPTGLLVLCLALGPAACSGHESPEAKGTAPAAADTAVTDSTAAAGAPSDSTVSDTVSPAVRQAVASLGPRSSWFPHAPHLSAKVDCRRCHKSIPGHATHAAVACQSCHTPPAGAGGAPPDTMVCRSCHHGARQKISCAACHDPLPAPLTIERRLQLSVWSSPRTRTLTFPHAPHASLGCRTCHVDPPLLTPTRTCGSCHERHHRAGAVCSTCHQAPPPTAHDLRAHVSCSGTGCHAPDLVKSIPRTRPTCLVCHQDRANHQPGQECASCHRVEFGS